jgi:hypothetical protein
MQRNLSRSPISIIGLLRKSPKALSVDEIVSKRHRLDNLTEDECRILRNRTIKYVQRLQNENKIFRGRRADGTEVWTDQVIKLENDPELDYYRLSIKELLIKYGRRQEK